MCLVFRFQVVALFCWVVAVCVGVFVIYIPYTKYVDDLGPWSDTLQAVYEALGRPVWAICAAWVVYACAAELAGMRLALIMDTTLFILIF